jgi:polysaccharide biosynthesis protein PslH
LLAPLQELLRQMVLVDVPTRPWQTRLRQFLTSTRPDLAFRLYSPNFTIALTALLQQTKFDIVQIEGLELAWTLPTVREISPASKIIFDNHNAETVLQERTLQADWQNPTRWLAALYSAVQVWKLQRYETWACISADAVTAVSETDQRLLHEMMPDLHHTIEVIPNSMDIAPYLHLQPHADPAINYDLVFIGKMDYRPNVDAVLWFGQEVWPRILSARPETKWAIVGQKPHARLDVVSTWPNVTMTGFVESVLPYLAGCKVVIMPLRMGSGTRLKFIEACASGRAIVTTTIGAEGFPVQAGVEAYIADEPEWFAEYTLGALRHDEGRRKLGQAAQMLAKQYDWRVVVPRFTAVYKRLLYLSEHVPPPSL